uniref:Uncharacterized protein n=1 Tax=Panagrolaimus sp. ES5 TaxID=591445 RepID=A0AC34GDJ1_9BILA
MLRRGARERRELVYRRALDQKKRDIQEKRFGRDLVFKCSDVGMQVLAACLTDSGVESLKKEAKGPGAVTPFKMDVRSDESIEAAKLIVEEVTKKYE